MELEQQVTRLEISKRLKELGVKQESLFWWVEKGGSYEVWPYWETQNRKGFNAFTVAELGEMLPQYLLVGKYSHELTIIRSGAWRFYYGMPNEVGSNCVYLTATSDATEADARGKMLIYLLENHLITL